MNTGSATLRKAERVYKRSDVKRLFEGNGKSFSIFPLRVVYMPAGSENEDSSARILISVPKRCFKRAAKRNRVKRQIRESYRLNKHLLSQSLKDSSKGVMIAFIWLDKELHTSEEVASKVKIALNRIAEKMNNRQ